MHMYTTVARKHPSEDIRIFLDINLKKLEQHGRVQLVSLTESPGDGCRLDLEHLPNAHVLEGWLPACGIIRSWRNLY